jgi:hypothetical protein
MCNRLVRKGLVARQERPDDRRVAWITLTAAGRDLVGEATRRRRERLAELVAGLTMTRPLAFASVLNAMVEGAGEVPDRQWWQQWRDAEISPATAADYAGLGGGVRSAVAGDAAEHRRSLSHSPPRARPALPGTLGGSRVLTPRWWCGGARTVVHGNKVLTCIHLA